MKPSMGVTKALLGVTLGLSSCLTYGATVTAHGDYFVAANPNFGIPANISDNQTQTSNTSASVAIGTGYGSGMGAAGATAYADNLGVIGTRAGGVEQDFYANSSASSSTTVTNNTGNAMRYFYTLNIPYSRLGVYANWFGAGDTFSATNQYSVTVNGNSIWNSLANVQMTTAGVNLTTSGQTLPWTPTNFGTSSLYVDSNTGIQGYEGGGSLELTGYSVLLDLGVWATGQSLTLDYNLFSSVSVNAPSSCGYECLNISAETGDPNGISGTPILGTITSAPVPVPSAVWLLGSGLISLIGVARRHIA